MPHHKVKERQVSTRLQLISIDCHNDVLVSEPNVAEMFTFRAFQMCKDHLQLSPTSTTVFYQCLNQSPLYSNGELRFLLWEYLLLLGLALQSICMPKAKRDSKAAAGQPCHNSLTVCYLNSRSEKVHFSFKFDVYHTLFAFSTEYYRLVSRPKLELLCTRKVCLTFVLSSTIQHLDLPSLAYACRSHTVKPGVWSQRRQHHISRRAYVKIGNVGNIVTQANDVAHSYWSREEILI